jgi:acyl dehydratase
MTETWLGPFPLQALNTSRDSDNKIHDDAVARRFGFAGGLVPGVDVYGYLTRLPVARWGRAWLERGTAECRFLKPVYDGESVTLSAVETVAGLELRAESRGLVCAVGHAALPPPRAAPVVESFAAPPPPAVRPEADAVNLAVGTRLSIRAMRTNERETGQHRSDLRETLPLYRAENLVHPATIAGLGNWALKDNVTLGPWMHVGSRIEHFAAARIGDELTAAARVTANYERKGHHFADLDVLVYANRTTLVARLGHLSIYRMRERSAA